MNRRTTQIAHSGQRVLPGNAEMAESMKPSLCKSLRIYTRIAMVTAVLAPTLRYTGQQQRQAASGVVLGLGQKSVTGLLHTSVGRRQRLALRRRLQVGHSLPPPPATAICHRCCVLLPHSAAWHLSSAFSAETYHPSCSSGTHRCDGSSQQRQRRSSSTSGSGSIDGKERQRPRQRPPRFPA